MLSLPNKTPLAVSCLVIATLTQPVAATNRSEQVRLHALLSGAAHNRPEIASGAALNHLVQIVQHRGLTVSPYPLQAVEIAHIQLRRGSRGVAFRADTGQPLQFCLPTELLGDEYRDTRVLIARARRQVLEQLAAGRATSAAWEALIKTIDRLQEEFQRDNQAATKSASIRDRLRYREICRHLADVREEIRSLMHDEVAVPGENLRFYDGSLPELVTHLTDNYLEFAPSRCDSHGLAAYTLIYEILLRAVSPLRDELVGELVADREERVEKQAKQREDRFAMVHEQSKRVSEARQNRIDERKRLDLQWQAYWRNFPHAMAQQIWLQRLYNPPSAASYYVPGSRPVPHSQGRRRVWYYYYR